MIARIFANSFHATVACFPGGRFPALVAGVIARLFIAI